MALVKCRECGGQVSDSAVSCPNCGCQPIAVREALLSQHHALISSLSSEGCLLSLVKPHTLVETVPEASLAGNAGYGALVENCARPGVLYFSGQSPATPRRVSNAALAWHPEGSKGEKIGAFISVCKNGKVCCGDRYMFRSGRSSSVTFFAFDDFIHGLRSHLRRLVKLYTVSQVPAPYWLLVSLVGIKATRLGSSAFEFPELNTGDAIEADATLEPIPFTGENVANDDLYFSVAEGIWHVYGHDSYPRQNLNTIFRGGRAAV